MKSTEPRELAQRILCPGPPGGPVTDKAMTFWDRVRVPGSVANEEGVGTMATSGVVRVRAESTGREWREK